VCSKFAPKLFVGRSGFVPGICQLPRRASPAAQLEFDCAKYLHNTLCFSPIQGDCVCGEHEFARTRLFFPAFYFSRSFFATDCQVCLLLVFACYIIVSRCLFIFEQVATVKQHTSCARSGCFFVYLGWWWFLFFFFFLFSLAWAFFSFHHTSVRPAHPRVCG
jgi:hypothetical protein